MTDLTDAEMDALENHYSSGRLDPKGWPHRDVLCLIAEVRRWRAEDAGTRALWAHQRALTARKGTKWSDTLPIR